MRQRGALHCTDVSCCVAVAAVQDFCYLCEDMGTWGPVPHAVISALVPEKTVKHSKKMLPRDYRMRIFMPKDCQHGAMYLCEQAHVDLANSAHGGTFLFLQLLLTPVMMLMHVYIVICTNLGGCSYCCYQTEWASAHHQELACASCCPCCLADYCVGSMTVNVQNLAVKPRLRSAFASQLQKDLRSNMHADAPSLLCYLLYANSICGGNIVTICMLTFCCELFIAVLLSCVLTRGTIRICLPERRSAEQNTLMSQLARQAEAAWQLPGHPGWYAAKCMEDSETLLDLLRQKVPHLCAACHHCNATDFPFTAAAAVSACTTS